MRRLRTSAGMARLVAETSLSLDDLVYPLFVCPGSGVEKPIKSMTGCFHFSVDMVAKQAREVYDLGIGAVIIFGLPEAKDPVGSQAAIGDSTVAQAVRQIKKNVPGLIVITDVCLCAYTDHGHCGIIKNGKVDNDSSCKLLAEVALSHAKAGADIVAPSDMMDGRVGFIRKALDEAKLTDVAIMSYSAKYASAFYGPFRDAAESAPSTGNRKTYQMDPANANEALREIKLDIEEGADIVMVKPALPYLDIISRAKERFSLPIAAYNVSGEYMMINAAAEAGLIDRDKAMMESLLSIKRAGAGIIITYFAKDAARLIKHQ